MANINKIKSSESIHKKDVSLTTQATQQSSIDDIPSLEAATQCDESKVVTWEDITIKVSLGRRTIKQILKREEAPGKIVLYKVSGYAFPGTTLAIMGQSGSGKTVLINALTGFLPGDVNISGKVCVNGEQLTPTNMHRISCYVQQHDLFIGTLTVKEQLTYSAELRMGDATDIEKKTRVEEVIRELGLKQCETTQIGIPNRVKGISCGESKRLAFGCEILTDPAILFCDEPTSGLDSFMAVQIVNCLKNLAIKGKTIITTIHQPSSQVFNMFDNVCFLTLGEAVYFGPVSEVCNFFREVGFNCPPTYNPADFVIRALSLTKNAEKSYDQIKKIKTKFEESALGMSLYRKSHGQDIKSAKGNIDLKVMKRYPSSFRTQFMVLLRRSFLTTLRDPLLLKVKLFQVIATSLIIGIVNFRTPVTGPTIMNLEGILYNTVRDMNFMFLFPSINVLPTTTSIFGSL